MSFIIPILIIILIVLILLVKDYIETFIFDLIALPLTFKQIKKNTDCSNLSALKRCCKLLINPFKPMYSDQETTMIYQKKNAKYLKKQQKKGS